MKRYLLFLCFCVFLLVGTEGWAITGLGIGVRGGIVQSYRNNNLNSIPNRGKNWLEGTPTVGVHLKIGTLRIIQLEASAEYSWRKKEITLDDQPKADFKTHDFSLNGTAKYVFSFPIVKPFLGAGAGMHRLVYSLSYKGSSIHVPEDQSRIGFHGVGGVLLSFPAIPWELSAEARYTVIQTKGDPTRYLTILAGLTLNLP
ncbi:MAG: outer membrane beta-barrel protein [Candidatus Zixiibacteriota bacterium]